MESSIKTTFAATFFYETCWYFGWKRLLVMWIKIQSLASHFRFVYAYKTPVEGKIGGQVIWGTTGLVTFAQGTIEVEVCIRATRGGEMWIFSPSLPSFAQCQERFLTQSVIHWKCFSFSQTTMTQDGRMPSQMNHETYNNNCNSSHAEPRQNCCWSFPDSSCNFISNEHLLSKQGRSLHGEFLQ